MELSDAPSVTRESEALPTLRCIQRFNELSTMLQASNAVICPALDPLSRDPSRWDLRSKLDVSCAYVNLHRGSANKAAAAHKAWLELREAPDVTCESEALGLQEKYARLAQVQQAWRHHGLDDVDQLSVDLSGELAKKYPVTAMYINGDFTWAAKTLESTIAARIKMRDKNLAAEPLGTLVLKDLPRQPGAKHVYVCPCGYFAGERKMTRHLHKNKGIENVKEHRKGC